ncbi:MAG: hypothetical protein MHMPM18_000820 [Marteilia pararefringens]
MADTFEVYRGSKDKNDQDVFYDERKIKLFGRISNIQCYNSSFIKYSIDHFPSNETFDVIWWINAFTEMKDQLINHGSYVDNYGKKQKGSNLERLFSIEKSFEDLKVSGKNEIFFKKKFKKLENFMRLNNINIFCAADIESILSKDISILNAGDLSTHFVETFIDESLNKVGSIARMRKCAVFRNEKSNRQSLPQFYSFLPCNSQMINTILSYLRQFNTNSSIMNPSKNSHYNNMQEFGFSPEKFNEIVGIVCCTESSPFIKRINTIFLLNWLIMDNKILKINKGAYFVL